MTDDPSFRKVLESFGTEAFRGGTQQSLCAHMPRILHESLFS